MQIGAGSQLKITIIDQVGYFGHHPRNLRASERHKNFSPSRIDEDKPS